VISSRVSCSARRQVGDVGDDAVGAGDGGQRVLRGVARLLDDAAVDPVAVAHNHVAAGPVDGGGHLLRHLA